MLMFDLLLFHSEVPTKKTKDFSDSEDEFDKMERERRDDQKEREEFTKRLLEKDKDKTRSVMSKSDKKVSFRNEQD